MRRFIALTMVLGLVVVGSTTATASSRRATTPGVTKKAIKLGVTYVDLSNLGGTIDIDFGDWQKIYEVLIDDFNANGGVNGRELNPVFAPVEPIGTVPAEEACVHLTEDEQVFAVTGFFLTPPLCYLEAHNTPVVNGAQTAEDVARAKAPWFTLDPDDHFNSLAIDAFAAEGAFKGGKLGIVVDAQSQALYDDVVAPALKRNKVKGTVVTIDVVQGDEVATQQAARPIVERFDSDGINKILFVGTSAVQFGNVLAQTDYRPRMIVLNYTILRAFVQNPGSAVDVAKNAIGAYTLTDFNDPTLQKCFKVVEKELGYVVKETVGPDEPDYRSSSEIACRAIGLFAAIAEAAGKNLTVESFGKAPLKGSLEVPGTGTITYDKKFKTFLQPVYIYRYDPATKTLVADDKPAA